MNFSLIICTYQRPAAILSLLHSVQKQTSYPKQIVIVDGSEDYKTRDLLQQHSFKNLEYYNVTQEHRGLTRQRNFGINKVAENAEIVCFLDDDTVLHANYFEEVIDIYIKNLDAVGVGGYITNENIWMKVESNYQVQKGEFFMENWVRTEGSRFQLRRKFGLAPDAPPGIMPSFSHGYSIGFLPPTGKTYAVELLMGGVASYRKAIFEKIQFSTYFEGYGLYEDADFSLRASKLGKLYVNTNAQLEHFHEAAGRPNNYKYGKMVVRNGWYVWQVKYPHPTLKARLKWHATALLLTLVRFGNVFTATEKRQAFTESLGRTVGWWSLLLNKPKLR